jgi:hypothetical protein
MQIKNAHIKNVHINVRTIVRDGLQLYLDAGNSLSYPGSGTIWTDLINGKEFTLYNSPNYNSGNGGYLTFVPDAQQYAEATSFPSSLANWSLEVWHYYDGTYNMYGAGNSPCLVTEIYPGGGTINFALGNCSDSYPNLQVGHWDGSNWYPNPQGYSLTAGHWHHIVGTFDGSTHQLYVNGIPVSSGNSPNTATRSGAGIRLMRRWDYHNYWGGRLAVVRIYNTALNVDEVTQNFNAERSRF